MQDTGRQITDLLGLAGDPGVRAGLAHAVQAIIRINAHNTVAECVIRPEQFNRLGEGDAVFADVDAGDG